MVSYGEIDHQQFGCKPWVTLCVMGVKPTTHFDEELQKKNVPKRTKGRGNSTAGAVNAPKESSPHHSQVFKWIQVAYAGSKMDLNRQTQGDAVQI